MTVLFAVFAQADQNHFFTIVSADTSYFSPVTSCEKGEIRNEKILGGFGPQQWQAKESKCYAFATRDILQNHICQTEKCEFDLPRIGVKIYAPQPSSPASPTTGSPDTTSNSGTSSTPRKKPTPEEIADENQRKEAERQAGLKSDEDYYRMLLSAPQKDLISVADLMAQDKAGIMNDNGGEPPLLLKRFSKSLMIASEDCAPYDAKVAKRALDARFDDGEAQSLDDAIEALEKDYAKKKNYTAIAGGNTDPCPYVQALSTLAEVKLETQDVVNALNYYARTGSNTPLSQLLFIPKNCVRKKVAPFQIRNFDGSRDQLSQKIEELLAKNIPIVVNHCMNLPNEKSFNKRGCGAHDVDIVGTRDLCCGDASNAVCTRQYKIRDSARFRVSGAVGSIVDPSADDQGWEDENTFLDRIVEYKKHYWVGVSEIFTKTYEPLTWIEP